MARLFGDGFDMYATVVDIFLGRWGTMVGSGISLVAGANTAFTVGQAVRFNTSATASMSGTFETGTNETTIYFSIRFKNTGGGATTQGFYLELRDGANVQCTIGFKGDNILQVRSGDHNGTVLSSLSSAYSSATWDSYQGKIVINNTTGSVEIRKNGSTSPIINITGVNTRAGSTNNYANQFILVQSIPGAPCNMDIDDFWLNSDNGAAPTSWPGDVRVVTSMVASTFSQQFLPHTTTGTTTGFIPNSSNSKASGVGMMSPFTAPYTGTVGTATVSITTGGTGNLKAAIYDATVTTVLATSNVVVNPGAGNVTVTFPTPPAVTKGTVYYLAFDQDFTLVYTVAISAALGFNTAYASFPAASPGTSAVNAAIVTATITPTINSDLVSEPIQDGDTTYVYDSTVGHEDKYGIAALNITPASILGVAPFVMWKKSDSGPRTGTISVTANGSADTGEIVGVTPSLSYTYNQKFMPLDPNSAAWSTANVNSMLLGLIVAS